MRFINTPFLLLPLCISQVTADFLLGTYPPPLDLSSNKSAVSASWKNLTQFFDSYIHGKATGSDAQVAALVKNVTFSVGLFSIHDPAVSKLQYHYTSPEVASFPNGTHKVDGDSIYRIASVSKLITVFTSLLHLTEDDWNRPVGQIIPDLVTMANPNGAAYTINWNEVTPWSLATQLSGIPAFGIVAGDDLFIYLVGVALGYNASTNPNPVTTMGYPPLDGNVLGPCLDFTCNASSFAESYRPQTPSFQTWSSPAYSDGAFMILGFITSILAGMPIEQVYQSSVFGPLGMTSSTSIIPTDPAILARCVITDSSFLAPGGLTSPSGGILSSMNDLNKLGIALLNSTLLPANVTRKWMKPQTHTSSLTMSVGGPWEIHRFIHPTTGKVTDLYTKLGESGSSGAALLLIPEYGAGISFGGTASNVSVKATVNNIIIDYTLNSIVPALEAQASVEAKQNYAGTYTSTDPKLNSSVTITVDKSTAPGSPKGLSISHWISNGTDVLQANFPGVQPVLHPSIANPNIEGPGQVTFQASAQLQTNRYNAPNVPAGVIGPFTGFYAADLDWAAVGQGYYGDVAGNMFVFNVDAAGKAVSVSPAVTRATLKKKV